MKPYLNTPDSPGIRWRQTRPYSWNKQKKLYRNMEMWPTFKELAGIHKSMTMGGAIKRVGLHPHTFYRLINGMTDCKLHTAMMYCDVLGCTLDGFGRAMVWAWETLDRRIAAEQAMEEARKIPVDTGEPES